LRCKVFNPAPQPGTAVTRSWAGYLAGAVWALRDAGHPIGGFDLALDSQVPAGAGLSSSAAVECATTLAVDVGGVNAVRGGCGRAADRPARRERLRRRSLRTDGSDRIRRVLLFDTRAGTIEHIPFEPAAHGLALLIVDTRVAHSLVDGEYAPPRGMRRPQTCSAYAGCATSGSTNCRPRCRRWTGRARPATDPQAARAPAWTRVW
jgi:galactokinase